MAKRSRATTSTTTGGRFLGHGNRYGTACYGCEERQGDIRQPGRYAIL